MLAQGQSSSVEGGLVADVSSGLIFLKKKKRKKYYKNAKIPLNFSHSNSTAFPSS